MILYVNGAGWGNTRTCPGLKKKIPYPLKTRLLNFKSVPLGAGRVPEKTRPVAIPSLGKGYILVEHMKVGFCLLLPRFIRFFFNIVKVSLRPFNGLNLDNWSLNINNTCLLFNQSKLGIHSWSYTFKCQMVYH